MKAWLKGGLIGLGLFLILSIISVILYYTSSSDMRELALLGPGIVLILIEFLFRKLFGLSVAEVGTIMGVSMPLSVFLIINVSFLFILGALIGWIIGKKKQEAEATK